MCNLSLYVKVFLLVVTGILSGCASAPSGDNFFGPSQTQTYLTPRASTYTDLISLPPPRGKVVAAVYNFRDQTGQYRPSPASTFSTAVSQGATALLTQAMNESGWFVTLEREGLQNLLTERKIIRAALNKPSPHENNNQGLPSLLAANVLFEGGITAYETNVKTGGAGARYFGIGAAEQYRLDQVTVSLRAVDIRTGQILNTISTTKTIYSQEMKADVFRFVEFKRLFEMEVGYTRNEPAQLCLMSAIESAVVHLIVQGIDKNYWALANKEDVANPVIQSYLEQKVEINAL